MFKEYLGRVAEGELLSRQEAQLAMELIMTGQTSAAQLGAFLTALRMRGETGAEIAGFAAALRNHALSMPRDGRQIIDTCGTGGDSKGTFNVSTTVAFVLAGAGINVAKHGNRGVSSSCGSADVLEALGVNINLSPEAAAQALREIKLTFLFAPCFHQAMKHAAPTRKELGFRTVFNVLGPLSNPAQATCQVMGVFNPALVKTIAEALVELGVGRAMVVSSLDGMDEISTVVPTSVAEVRGNTIKSYEINPADYGFSGHRPEDYLGGTPADNARVLRGILQGDQGPKRDIVLINAAAGLVVADKAGSLQEGLILAAESIDSGAALAKLEALVDFSRRSVM